jgi:hypothetical protein
MRFSTNHLAGNIRAKPGLRAKKSTGTPWCPRKTQCEPEKDLQIFGGGGTSGKDSRWFWAINQTGNVS